MISRAGFEERARDRRGSAGLVYAQACKVGDYFSTLTLFRRTGSLE